MKLLQLNMLKQKILAQGGRDAEFQKCIRAIIPPHFIKEAVLDRNRITLIAANKTFAQELFLQQEHVAAELKKHKEYQSHTLVIR